MNKKPNKKTRGSVPLPDQKILWGRAASICSFRDAATAKPCRKPVVHEDHDGGPGVVIGENAHIEGERPTSARYRASMTDKARNSYRNLILLCRDHHKVVDDQERTYTTDRLKHDKQAHEEWVRTTLLPDLHGTTPAADFVSEDVHSTILHVQMVPTTVYAAPCSLQREKTLKERTEGHGLPVLILRDRRLYTFADLSRCPDYLSPFLKLDRIERFATADWEKDLDKKKYLAEMLKRCLNKIAGHRGLFLDKGNDQYYFQPLKAGKERTVSYRSVAGRRSSKKVVWQPVIKATGEPRREWVHRAVRLRFEIAAPGRWFLSIRPEFHFTKDGFTPIPSERIGRRSTKRKSRMFNYDILTEVHFWRSYLGEGGPRIILDLGGQSLVVSCTLERVEITWPGVPDDAKPFRTADLEEDLFSVAGIRSVLEEAGEHSLARAARSREP